MEPRARPAVLPTTLCSSAIRRHGGQPGPSQRPDEAVEGTAVRAGTLRSLVPRESVGGRRVTAPAPPGWPALGLHPWPQASGCGLSHGLCGAGDWGCRPAGLTVSGSKDRVTGWLRVWQLFNCGRGHSLRETWRAVAVNQEVGVWLWLYVCAILQLHPQQHPWGHAADTTFND